jgi:ketosteroid isomerase-like protein
MRKLLLLAALAAAATSSFADLALAANLPADLAKAAHDYDQAQIRSDKAELTRLLADDYLLQNSAGQVQDKASFIADSTAPGFHIEPFVIEEPVEKVLGDTALLGGVSTLKGTDGGKAFSARLRFVDVWARRDGQWRVVFTQATRAPS